MNTFGGWSGWKRIGTWKYQAAAIIILRVCPSYPAETIIDWRDYVLFSSVLIIHLLISFSLNSKTVCVWENVFSFDWTLISVFHRSLPSEDISKNNITKEDVSKNQKISESPTKPGKVEEPNRDNPKNPSAEPDGNKTRPKIPLVHKPSTTVTSKQSTLPVSPLTLYLLSDAQRAAEQIKESASNKRVHADMHADEFIFRFEFSANIRLPQTRRAPMTNHK